MLSSRNYSLRGKRKAMKVLQVEDMEKVCLGEKSTQKDFFEKEIGQTLEAYVKDRDYLESKEIYDITLSICDTIQNLNSLNSSILFRSFNPINTIVTPNRKVIFIDSNISKIQKSIDNNDDTYRIFNDYANIKQDRIGQISRAREIYSIGMIMYFMATSKIPATRLEPFIEDSYGNNVESNLKRIIQKCFETDAKKRYVSIEELNREIVIELLKKGKHMRTSDLNRFKVDSSRVSENSKTKKSNKRKSKRKAETLLSKINSTLSTFF